MSLRFEQETNVYDRFGNLLGCLEEGTEGCDPVLVANKGACISPDELRDIADHLESL